MEFVGELFRRRMVSSTTLVEIFLQLLGKQIDIDDLLCEAAINLMNKVGPKFEEEIEKHKRKTAAKNQAADKSPLTTSEDAGKQSLESDYNCIFDLFK